MIQFKSFFQPDVPSIHYSSKPQYILRSGNVEMFNIVHRVSCVTIPCIVFLWSGEFEIFEAIPSFVSFMNITRRSDASTDLSDTPRRPIILYRFEKSSSFLSLCLFLCLSI